MHKTWMQSAGWLVVHLIQTNCNGIPDTMALRKGRCIFIEYKQPGEKPDPLQLYRHEQLHKAGFYVIVVDSMDFPIM